MLWPSHVSFARRIYHVVHKLRRYRKCQLSLSKLKRHFCNMFEWLWNIEDPNNFLATATYTMIQHNQMFCSIVSGFAVFYTQSWMLKYPIKSRDSLSCLTRISTWCVIMWFIREQTWSAILMSPIVFCLLKIHVGFILEILQCTRQNGRDLVDSKQHRLGHHFSYY